MSRSRRALLFLTSTAVLIVAPAHSALAQVDRAGNVKKPPAATPMQRADELLKKMTIEEKAMQVSSLYPMGLLGADGPIESQLDAQLGHGIGHICGLGTVGS